MVQHIKDKYETTVSDRLHNKNNKTIHCV